MNLLKQQFPIGLNANWVDAKKAPSSKNLRDWLLDPTSLTARLKKQCTHFNVVLLGQRIEQCQAHEANKAIHTGDDVLVREVLLFCDQQPHVFARSLLPLKSLTGEQKELTNLGEKPLGQVLFNNPKLHREILEVAEVQPNSRVNELLAMLKLNERHNLWARRSLFTIEDKPIMVAEVFLPPADAYGSET